MEPRVSRSVSARLLLVSTCSQGDLVTEVTACNADKEWLEVDGLEGMAQDQ